MAKGPKYGQEIKLSGFTRGGIPVGKRTGAKSSGKAPAPAPGERSYSKREIAALIGAGALTAGAGGLMIGALKQKGLR